MKIEKGYRNSEEKIVHDIFFDNDECFKEVENVKKFENCRREVYAPKDMEAAFKSALFESELWWEYKITIVEDMKNADILVDYGKENDIQYSKFAFSPFVVAYNPKDSYYNSLKKAEILIPSQYNKDNYEIDFLKVINEVLGEGEWKNLGINELEKIAIFYPSKETCYWHDFYDFMLVTINNGKYPTTQGELEKAEEIIQNDQDSKFYIKLRNNFYRNKQVSYIPSIEIIYGERDTYNIVDIPKIATK